MKKLALGAILGASLMISSSAFALTAMSDANMKAATGQAGVSITLDNVVIEQYAGSTTYTDLDGTDGTAGSIEISDKHSLKTFLAMTSAADYAADFVAATEGVVNIGTWDKAAALSIDVGNCSILAAGKNDNIDNMLADIPAAAAAVASIEANLAIINDPASDPTAVATATATVAATRTALANSLTAEVGATAAAAIAANIDADGNSNVQVAGVVIGLPTLLIKSTGDTYTVGVAMAGAANNGSKYIQITKGDSTMAILSGTVEIAAH